MEKKLLIYILNVWSNQLSNTTSNIIEIIPDQYKETVPGMLGHEIQKVAELAPLEDLIDAIDNLVHELEQ